MRVLEESKISKENCEELIRAIESVLISKFKKDKSEAKMIVTKRNLFDFLMDNPLALHDSPEKWALILLTEIRDFEAIDYFYEQ